MDERVTVLIVDDHALVRMGLRAYLESQPDLQVVGEAGSGAEAAKLSEALTPDVVLMDLAMPGMDGVEATRRLRLLSPRSQVVVLTSFDDDAHIFAAVKVGAISYLLKDASPERVADAVRSAARGEATLDPKVAARVLSELRGQHDQIVNPFLDLTEREQGILRLVAQGLPNELIAENLVISEKTVKGHVSNVLSKLHLANRTQAAIYAWREGFVRRDS